MGHGERGPQKPGRQLGSGGAEEPSAFSAAPLAAALGVEERLELLRVMLRSRECDRRAAVLFRQGRAPFHVSSAGHEALAAIALHLRPDDYLAPHYRDRALVLARGTPLVEMAREHLATAASHSAGRTMSGHYCDRDRNVFSVASPVASQCLPAAGLAWATRLGDAGGVVVCSTGEAATRQGEFYEAVAFAVERRLPVVFVVADNGYGISTPTGRMTPAHLGLLAPPLLERADGADAEAVHAAAGAAVALARAGGGPTVLWCDLDRLDSHSSADDQRVYRRAEELARLRDPVDVLAGRFDAATVEHERGLAAAEVEAAFEAAAAEGPADPAGIGRDLFSGAAPAPAPAAACGAAETMVAAVCRTLGEALRRDPRVVVFGQDVEDPRGGVFGLTRGLSTAAPGRVVNAPVAEASIVGVGVGLAAAGLRPVVELQFVDFAGPAWNQLSTQVATLRWRTAGRWECPLVIYAPWGAYLPGGGIWHSQSNEGLFTHLPGLRVAVPSRACDAAAIFEEALAGDDPTLVLLPKHLMRRREPPAAPGPARGARVAREGGEATVVTWGNGVELALEAAGRLAAAGVGVEVIDLRWLVPWDRAAVAASMRRTGRLVVVQEDARTSSFGATVVADVAGEEEGFYALLAPPRLVSRADVHVPYRAELERAVLPSVDDVVGAVRALLP